MIYIKHDLSFTFWVILLALVIFHSVLYKISCNRKVVLDHRLVGEEEALPSEEEARKGTQGDRL